MSDGVMRKHNGEPLPPELQAEVEALLAMSAEDIDLSDMPEITDWSRARRGLFGVKPRRTLSVSLEAELVDYVEKNGSG